MIRHLKLRLILLRCLVAERRLKARLVRNIDLQSVRPAGLQPAVSAPVQPAEHKTAESISAGHTGKMPMFRPAEDPRSMPSTTMLTFNERDAICHTGKQQELPYFVTFRLADAVPAQLASQWREELETWRKFHPEPWNPEVIAEYRKRFLQPREHWLDQGHGSCLLRDSRVAEVVAQALRFFDGQRYHLDTFVIMPNHVHVLVQPLTGYSLTKIIHSWKSYTAREINKLLGRSGAVWMQESFDRIVRDWDALLRCRAYIARNPEKARLRRR